MKKSYTFRYGSVKRFVECLLSKSWIATILCMVSLSLSGFGQSYQRVYANSETHSNKQQLLIVVLSEVQNAADAIDGNPQTASTLRANVGALSLIQAWQNLRFTGADVPTSTTPVTVKLGFGSSILDVLGGVFIQATLNGNPVGPELDSAALVGLLSSSNQDEITFTPGVKYDGVRVLVKPTLALGVEVNLFHAYFLKPATSPVCSAVPLDVLAGAGKYLSTIDLANFSSYVSNPFQAIDGDENTYATLHADIGVAAYTQETAIFSGSSLPGDSVRLVVSKPGGLLELDVLKKSISVVTYKGKVRVDSLGGVGSLLYLRLLAGPGNKGIISFASSGSFDRVQVRLGGVVSALSDLNLYEVQMVAPLPEVSIGGVKADTASICMDSSVVLEVINPQSGTTYSWWSASTGGTQLSSNAQYTVAAGQPLGTYKYYVQALRSGCTSVTDRKEIVVNVVEATSPTITQPTADTTVCLGQSVLLVASSGQDGATFNWYTVATGGTPIFTGKDSIRVTPSSSTTYYAETVLGSCSSATRTSIKINVVPPPSSPQVLPDTAYVTIGQTATFSVLNPDNNLEYKWYSPVDGPAIHTGTTFTTPAITEDTAYEVEASVPGGCTSAPTRVIVIALPLPSDVPCSYANTQQSPVYTGGIISVCLLCGVTDPEYAVDGNINTASNIRMNVGVSDYIGQLVKFQHQGKAGDSIRLILGLPTGLADVDLLSNVRIETYQGSTAGANPLYLNSSLLRLTLLSGNKFEAVIPATKDYDAVLISLGGNLNVTALTTLNLYNAEQLIPLPTINGGKDTLSVCPNSPATLTATPGPGTNLVWYDAATGGNQLAQGNSYTTDPITDTITYYIEALRDGCANLQRVAVTVAPAAVPTIPEVASDSVVICPGEKATLEVTNPLPGIKYVWYDVPTGGNALDTAETFTTPALTASKNYYVAAFSENCTLSSDVTKVQVVTGPQPEPPTLITDTVYVLSGNKATFTVANADPSLIYRWYDAATGGNLLHTGGDFTTPSLTARAIYYVQVSTAGGCMSASRTQAVALLSASSSAPCNTANEQESPIFTGGAVQLCLLCGVFEAPDAVDGDPNTASDIRMNVGVGLGASYIGQMVKFQHPGKSGDSIRLILGLPTGLADIQLLGQVRIETYMGTTSSGQSLYLNSSLLRLTLLSGNKFEAVIPAKADYDRVLVSIGGTLTALTTLNLYQAEQMIPLAVPVADTVGICSETKATLNVTVPQGVDVTWYDAPQGGNVLGTGTTLTTAALTANTTFYAESTRDGCPNTQRVPVTVKVGAPPAIPDVVSPDLAICSGLTATLHVKDPSKELEYHWYDAATGGNLMATDSVFTTQPLQSDKTFYVEAISAGGCLSPGRGSVKVTVNDVPAAPTVNPSSASVPAGGTVSFVISNPVPGLTYNWYGTANGGGVIHAGTTYTTPSLYNSTIFYVEAVNASGCASSIKTALPIDVTGFSDVPCSFATSQQTYFSGINLGMITDGAKAVDPDVNSASTIVRIVTALGYFGQQLIFPFQGHAGDSIHIKLGGAGTNILQLALLDGVYIKTFNGQTDNLDETNLGASSLIRLELLAANSNTGMISFKASKDYTSVAVYSKSLLNANLGGGLKVYYASAVVPEPELKQVNNTVCQGESVTLALNKPLSYVTYKWFDAPVGGSLLHTGTTFEVNPSATKIYYVQAERSSDNCPNPNRQSATVTVNPRGQAADIDVSGDGPLCAGEPATLTASSTTVTDPVFTWYSDAQLKNKISTGKTLSVTPTATTTYYVTVLGTGVCENAPGDAKTVTVTVNPRGQAADIDVSGDGPLCAGESTTLTASSSAVADPVFTWYSDAQLKNKISTRKTLTVTPTATTTYYVTVLGTGVCENAPGDAKTVTVTVNPRGKASDIVVNGGNLLCVGESTTLTASSTTVTGPVFTWYSDAQLKNKISTGKTLTVTPTATTTYYVTVLGTGVCENAPGDAKTVTVTVNPSGKAADIDVSGDGPLCAGEPATLTASSTTVTDPVFTWYTDAQLKNKINTGKTLTVTPTATTTYYVTVLGTGVCENAPGDAKAVTVTVNPSGKAADIDVSGDGPLCAGESTTLTASSTTVTDPVFNWYSDAQLKNKIGTGKTLSITPTATTTYYVTVLGTGVCENAPGDAKTVTVTVNPRGQAADIDVSGDGPLCAGEPATLTASSTTVTDPVFTWYSDAQLKNKISTGKTLTVTPTATTTYYVTVLGTGVCENAPGDAKTVTITVNPSGKASDIEVGGDGPLCIGESVTLTASSTTVTDPVFNWYSDAQLKNKIGTGKTLSITPTATTTYYVTVLGTGVCENAPGDAKTVTVTVNPSGKASDIEVGGDGPLCAGEPATLTASSTTVTDPVFTWYSDAQLKNKISTGKTLSITPTATTTYYVTVLGTGACENAPGDAKTVTVTVNPSGKASDIEVSGDDPLCAGASATLTASSTTVTDPVFNWYSDAQLKNKIGTGKTLNVTPTATTTYYVTVLGTGVCESLPGDALDVILTVNTAPLKPVLKEAEQTICSVGTATFEVTNPQNGITYQWYEEASGGTVVGSGPTFTTPVLHSSKAYYVEAVGASGCFNASGRTKATVTVTPPPEAPKVKISNISACMNSEVEFEIDQPQDDYTYNWYTAAIGGVLLMTGKSFKTPALGADQSYYVEAVTSHGCISASRTKVTAHIAVAPEAPVVTGNGEPICPGSTVTLTASSTTVGVSYKWYDAATGGNLVSQENPFTTPALDKTTTYYVEAVEGASGCVNATRTAVKVNVLEQLPPPDVKVQDADLSSITFTWSAVPGATGYEVSLDGGSTWQPPSSGSTGTSQVVSGLQPNQSVTIEVRTLGETACQNSGPSQAVTGKTDAVPGNKYFVPNAFTPNGDGNNDIWLVYGSSISTVHVVVYNQYGQLIFESRSQQNGWDGTFKGKMQPVGVYFYYLELTFQDGSKTTKKGSVTIVR